MSRTRERQGRVGHPHLGQLAGALAMLFASACRPQTAPVSPGATGSANPTVPPDGVYHCTDVSSPFAHWECLGAVDAELASHRGFNVRVTVRNGRRVSDERVNGHGSLVGGDSSRFVYAHDAAGRVVGESVFDAYGVERERYTYAPDGTRSERRNVWGELACDGQEGYTWVVALHERDAKGRRVRSRYQDAHGAPRTLGGDISELRLSGYGDGSQPGDVARFDAQGRPVENENGLHRALMRYSPWGELGARYLAADGSPARAHDRWGFDNQLDAIGNVIRVDSVDAQGNIVNNEGFGGRLVFVHDAHGNRIEERRFGPDGSPHEGNGGSVVRRTFDAKGRTVILAWFDAGGQPTRLGNFARKDQVRDAAGAIVEERFFRADGRPGQHVLGGKLAVVGYVYDERHNLIETRRFAADGSAGVDADGVSTTLRRYHHDKLVEIEYRGPANELHNLNGVARVKYHRDPTGMLIGRTFEDASGAVVKAYDYHLYGINYAGSKSSTVTKRTKEEALARANALVAAYARSGSFWRAGEAHGDDPNAQPGRERGASALWPELAAALERTPVGGITGVVETPAGFFVGKRLR